MMWGYGQGMGWMWLWALLLLIGIALLMLPIPPRPDRAINGTTLFSRLLSLLGHGEGHGGVGEGAAHFLEQFRSLLTQCLSNPPAGLTFWFSITKDFKNRWI